MFLSQAVEYIKLTFYVTKMNIIAQMQYRFNFFLQILSVFFNDSALVFIWMIFFKQIPTINGWTFQDTALLLGIAWTAIAIYRFFFVGIEDLSTIIHTGQLDQYIVLPKSVLWQVSTHKQDFEDLGTIFVSTYLLYTSGYVNFYKIPLVLILIFLSTLITYNLFIIIFSLSFYFGELEYSVKKLSRTFFDLIFYPQSIFKGFMRFITITILPSFFVGLIPLNLIKEFNFIWFLILILFAVLQTIFAHVLFNKGLQRYESGNLITVKM